MIKRVAFKKNIFEQATSYNSDNLAEKENGGNFSGLFESLPHLIRESFLLSLLLSRNVQVLG